MYKSLYVPASFHQEKQEKPKVDIIGKAGEFLGKTYDEILDIFHRMGHNGGNINNSNHDDDDDNVHYKTPTKRACFAIDGGVGSTVRAQTVLPDLSDFTYDSSSKCPHVSLEHRHATCELWKFITNVGEKKNTYKFWVKRVEGTNLTIPVHYYMLGYDTLLGSHYDRYDITYINFKADAATDESFAFDVQGNQCRSMPGPGDDASDAEKRAHFVIQNPIHEYVVQPHRYDHIDHHFEKFSSQYEKRYIDQKMERSKWFNFMHNFRFINGKNRELKEYKLEVNKFADNNLKELSYLRGRRPSKGYNGGLDYAQHHHLLRGSSGEQKPLPETYDWAVYGAVTPVKDQAVCGSCWSFGTSGSVEGAYFVKTGKLIRLSQQQLIDCSWQYGNNGCDGGEDFRAYEYIKNAGGLSSEEDYGHYKGIDGKCHDMDVEKPVKIKGFYNVTMGDPEALKHALINYGPVSVSIDASRPTFTFYSHGAYYDDKCQNSPDNLDHSVLVVGYTKINGKLVWKVKNSWSTYWGNDGYIYMSAENNNCGVLDVPTVPIIDA